MIPLPEYAKIKDNYCVAYLGHNKEYIVQLRLLRPFAEEHFPGIKLFICCRDDYMYLLDGQINTLPLSSLQETRKGFAYVRELLCDMRSNPVQTFMEESSIPYGPIWTGSRPKIESCGSCVILTNGLAPTKSLRAEQIINASLLAKSKGFEPHINKKYQFYDWVIGVENDQLYEAAASGKAVTLINNGFGENMFRKMFPDCEIVKL